MSNIPLPDKKLQEKARRHLRYLNDKEKSNTQSRDWYQAHKEQSRKRGLTWWENNKEAGGKRRKEYKKLHKDESNLYLREWRKRNRPKERERKARMTFQKQGITTEIFTREEIFKRDKWICQICKIKVDKKLSYPDPLSASLDHIVPLSKGGIHTRGNVQLAHLTCNVLLGVGGIKQTRLF